MTPIEKAKELVYKMHVKYEPKIEDKGGIYYFNMSIEVAKQSALICIDEILDTGLLGGDYRNDQSTINDFSTVTWYINYWEEVKQEINNL